MEIRRDTRREQERGQGNECGCDRTWRATRAGSTDLLARRRCGSPIERRRRAAIADVLLRFNPFRHHEEMWRIVVRAHEYYEELGFRRTAQLSVALVQQAETTEVNYHHRHQAVGLYVRLEWLQHRSRLFPSAECRNDAPALGNAGALVLQRILEHRQSAAHMTLESVFQLMEGLVDFGN